MEWSDRAVAASGDSYRGPECKDAIVVDRLLVPIIQRWHFEDDGAGQRSGGRVARRSACWHFHFRSEMVTERGRDHRQKRVSGSDEGRGMRGGGCG